MNIGNIRAQFTEAYQMRIRARNVADLRECSMHEYILAHEEERSNPCASADRSPFAQFGEGIPRR